MTRAERVVARLDGIDALLVTDLVNLRYLTGFTGSAGMCVMGEGLRRFVTDSRYTQRAHEEVDGFDLELAAPKFFESLKEGWPEAVRRVGFEADQVTVRGLERLRAGVPEGIELVPSGGQVEAERAVKDADELRAITAAAELADAALDGLALIGRSERDVALAIEDAMRAGGGEPAFATIVASGPNGASPHAGASARVIERGELVTIDWGVRLDGYCSDCTRTFAAGAVSGGITQVYALVAQAQAAALAAIAPGVGGRELDSVARDVIVAAGHGEHFGHSLGHGVGLAVHEAPRLAQTSDSTLESGNVVTVEPGVYVPGEGGVRIEDLVVVTAQGAEVLSGHTKALTNLD